MTIPTQAQIEAIRRALRSMGCFGLEVCKISPCKCAESIAALTAAAKVGEPSKMFAYISGQSDGKIAELEAREEYALGHLGSQIEENEKLRAELAATIERCAQVGGSTKNEWIAWACKMEAERDNLKRELAATIERCAQVAKDYGLSRMNDEKDYPATVAAAIAYSIEALKDKP